MPTTNKKPCIGLFGTCDKSTWRNEFITLYENLNIDYFNPQVENWTDECAAIEANHLANDEIILFPVTDETYGIGSLAEIGFSIIQAAKLDNIRDFIIFIDPKIDSLLSNIETNIGTSKESLRARKLVIEHLKKINLSNVYIVSSLKEMLKISLKLYEASKIKLEIKNNEILT